MREPGEARRLGARMLAGCALEAGPRFGRWLERPGRMTTFYLIRHAQSQPDGSTP